MMRGGVGYRWVGEGSGVSVMAWDHMQARRGRVEEVKWVGEVG